jgi:hypothetical protein
MMMTTFPEGDPNGSESLSPHQKDEKSVDLGELPDETPECHPDAFHLRPRDTERILIQF